MQLKGIRSATEIGMNIAGFSFKLPLFIFSS